MEGDRFGCDPCVGCEAWNCVRGGYYAAVRYWYSQFAVTKQVRDENGKWQSCGGCSEESTRLVTIGIIWSQAEQDDEAYSAVIRNNQRPFVPELMTLADYCATRPGDPGPVSPEPPGPEAPGPGE